MQKSACSKIKKKNVDNFKEVKEPDKSDSCNRQND